MKLLKLIKISTVLFLFTSAACKSPTSNKSKAHTILDTSVSIDKLINGYKDSLQHSINRINALFEIASHYAIISQNDSAFKYLTSAAELDTDALLFNYGDLYTLMQDERWKAIEQTTFNKALSKYKVKDTTIVKALWRIKLIDQCYYTTIHFYEKKYSPEYSGHDSLWLLREKAIQPNIQYITQLIDKIGWPKKSEYTKKGSKAVFYALQHSTDSIISKYLPLLTAACQANEADWDDYAHMVDRILVFNNHEQIYGTHYAYESNTTDTIYLMPTKDTINLDKRRNVIGLKPIKAYYKTEQIRFQSSKRK
jgi:hypothetical protein